MQARAQPPPMASSHLTTVLLDLTDREVTVQDGNQRSDHEGSLTVATPRTGGTADGSVTLTLAADPTAAREQAMSVSLSAADAASLEAALAEARAED